MRLAAKRILHGLLVCVVVATFLCAQSDLSQISGLVNDKSGAAIANATVTIRNEATGVQRATVTNGSGEYVVTALASGLYTLTVEAVGFKRFQKSGNKLNPGIPGAINVSLDVGDVHEVVEVRAAGAEVQTDAPVLDRLVNEQEVAAMPLEGRDPIWLALLEAGVVYNQRNNLGGLSFQVSGGSFYINGSTRLESNIFFDGAEALRVRARGTTDGVPDLDATQEVQVLTSNYSAEYGGTSGGQIRVVTKGGNRDFHASLYEYFMNGDLNSNSWTRNASGVPSQQASPAPFNYNQFGYRLSGPVYIPFIPYNHDRNKLFWSFGQAWTRYRTLSTSTGVVPDAAMRQGNFSELLGKNLYYSTPQIITDPLTGKPFLNNIIPAARLSPNGVGLLNSYPLPTPGIGITGQTWYASESAPQNDVKSNLAVDFDPAPGHQFRYRLQKYNFNQISPFNNGTDRVSLLYKRPNSTQSLGWVWTISPSIISEALVTMAIGRYNIGVDTALPYWERSQYGINYPYMFASQGKEYGDKIPTVTLGSPFLTVDGSPYPSKSREPAYTAEDKFTIVRGVHTLKFGFMFTRLGEDDLDETIGSPLPGSTNNQNGAFTFLNSQPNATGLAIGNAALGLFNTYAEIGARANTPYRANAYEWFVQDSWKVTSKLTVELGLRHSIFMPFWSLNNDLAVFDPALYNPSQAVVQNPKTGQILSGNLYNGVCLLGSGPTARGLGRDPILASGLYKNLYCGLPSNYMDTHYKDFQPRLGIAYRLSEKTVFRAGAGRYISQLTNSDQIFLGANPPFQPTVVVSNGNVDTPGGTGASIGNYPWLFTGYNQQAKNPQAYQWNATIQRDVGFSTVVEASYVGRRGLYLQYNGNINQLQPGTVQANPGINVDTLRPYKGYGVIRDMINEGSSRYNALQVTARHRFKRGLTFTAAYTLSKSEDNASEVNAAVYIAPNVYNISNMWGPSNFDARQALVFNYIYELPFFHDTSRWTGRLLGGWQLSGLTQFQSGFPLTVSLPTDYAGVGPGSGSQLWNVNGNPCPGPGLYSTGANSGNYFFNTKNSDGTPIFTQPAAGTFTTTFARNAVCEPGFQNWNIALSKTFAITERHKFLFRAESFNFLNLPNWNAPTINPTSPLFGMVASKTGERDMQLTLRYSF